MKISLIPLLLASATAFAQAPRMDTLVSPEVLPDRRVTFRVRAPKASEVSLFGDWMTPNTEQTMTRDDQGVWSATIGPLEPGLAIYTFTADGVTMHDPVNPRIKLRARTSASLVDVPGQPPTIAQRFNAGSPRTEREGLWDLPLSLETIVFVTLVRVIPRQVAPQQSLRLFHRTLET